MAQGVNVLLSGLAMQAASLLLFLLIYWRFRYCLSHRHYTLDPRHSDVYFSKTFGLYFVCRWRSTRIQYRDFVLTSPAGAQIVVGLLLLRTAIRIVQFSPGTATALGQFEVIPLVLDGVLVLLASVIMTVIPPGAAFGSAWGPTSPFSKNNAAETVPLDQSQVGLRHISPETSASKPSFG